MPSPSDSAFAAHRPAQLSLPSRYLKIVCANALRRRFLLWPHWKISVWDELHSLWQPEFRLTSPYTLFRIHCCFAQIWEALRNKAADIPNQNEWASGFLKQSTCGLVSRNRGLLLPGRSSADTLFMASSACFSMSTSFPKRQWLGVKAVFCRQVPAWGAPTGAPCYQTKCGIKCGFSRIPCLSVRQVVDRLGDHQPWILAVLSLPLFCERQGPTTVTPEPHRPSSKVLQVRSPWRN